MITITLRQPLSCALDEHSLVMHHAESESALGKANPAIERNTDDYVNRIDAIIPA